MSEHSPPPAYGQQSAHGTGSNEVHQDTSGGPRVEPRNGFGMTALIVGLIGILFGLVPLTGFIAVGLGIVGLVLGFAALGRLRRRMATNRKTTWVGLVSSTAAVALGIWGMTIVFGAVDQLERDLGEISEELDRDITELEEQFEDDSETLDEWAACVDAIDIAADDFEEQVAVCDEILE